MRYPEEDRVSRGEGVFDREAIAGTVPTAIPSGGTHAKVLAQVPDVDEAETSRPSRWRDLRRGDGRIISRPLAIKLLIGGGALLLLVAVASFVLRKPRIEGDKVLAPKAPEAPVFDPNATPHVVAPTMATPPAELNFEIPGGPNLAIPDTGGSGPVQHEVAAPTPAWMLPQSAPASTAPNETSGYSGPYEVEPPMPGYGEQYQPPPDVMPVPPDRNAIPEPAEPTSPRTTYDYPVRQPQYQARSDYRRHATAPATEYPTAAPATRYPATSYPATGPGASYPSSISYPAASYPPASSYPAAYPPAASYPGAESGGARLEGIITNPSVRTTHERARSNRY